MPGEGCAAVQEQVGIGEQCDISGLHMFEARGGQFVMEFAVFLELGALAVLDIEVDGVVAARRGRAIHEAFGADVPVTQGNEQRADGNQDKCQANVLRHVGPQR
ncbi:hypothetical protein D3C84_1012390 [compost metagenome]